ncbi:C6 finger domain-containingprotein [Purpureocillium lavendulum]|uniref:C6 finger domain-containingprotein n=1 Tax=Purpureocillium lavendulum TaxID=1247861 RepID=A0AB34FTX2_9HYPO|nr:C6 finger domain-containingprotein [Purpureocillium lavendulum]
MSVQRRQLNDNDDGAGSSGGAEEASAAGRRRSHRKSHNGCLVCKSRHIRCDESRPECLNCARAVRECHWPVPKQKSARTLRREAARRRNEAASAPSPAETDKTSLPVYGGDQRQHQHQLPTHEAGDGAPMRHPLSRGAHSEPMYRAPSSREGTLPALSPYEPDDQAESRGDAPIYTLQHLRFLHHAESAEGSSIMTQPHTAQILDIAVRRADDAPYLLDAVLALSALHLASTLADKSPAAGPNSPSPSYISRLHHQSTELQTRALASFTRQSLSVEANDTKSAIPRFLFSAVLSRHNLVETLDTVRHLQSSDFHVFIHKFADCMGLHRGIRAVLGSAWENLRNSELEPLLNVTRDADARANSRRARAAGAGVDAGDDTAPDPDSECAHLLVLLDASDLGTATDRACRDAVERLQWAFNLHHNLDRDAGPHAASAFSVTVCAEYVDVLRRLQPEALVILAHYGVLLHRHRRLWPFHDAGARMIDAIARHLGAYWSDAMSWPLEQLETDK